MEFHLPQPHFPKHWPPLVNWLNRLLHPRFATPEHWRRRGALWLGAVLVALAALLFAKLSDAAFGLFLRLVHWNPWWPLLVTPPTFAALAWLTSGSLKNTRGSGIQQVIAALTLEGSQQRENLLGVPVALGKLGLTLVSILVGASVGREGPTVHVGASILYNLGRRLGIGQREELANFILAGGAAGIAAAFNTPLAGIMFAIEELAGRFAHKLSGRLLTAVVIGGAVSLGLAGNYAYFGKVSSALTLGNAWLAVIVLSVLGGVLGGLFVKLMLLQGGGLLAHVRTAQTRWPILFPAVCGAVLVLVGLLSGNTTYGTGYEQARAILQHASGTPGQAFSLLKFASNVISAWSGTPGGIFSPALAVGAGLGQNVALLLPQVPVSALALLGVSAYLAAVTGAPLTAAVIAIEISNNQDMIIPIMAACLLSRLVAGYIYPTPIYRALADRILNAAQTETPPASERN